MDLHRREGCEAGEFGNDVGDEGPDAVDDGPANPDAFEPVPRLVYLVLVVGELRADHGHGGHEARQDRADTRDLRVQVNNDGLCHGKQVLYRKSGTVRQAQIMTIIIMRA